MSYCARADVERMFGAGTVLKWADLDNDNSTDIDDRIDAACEWATHYIDGVLAESPYDVPFTTVPTMVKEIAIALAGVQLYEGRGVEDFDPAAPDKTTHRLSSHKRRAMRDLSYIRAGILRLHETEAAQTATAIPTIPDETSVETLVGERDGSSAASPDYLDNADLLD